MRIALVAEDCYPQLGGVPEHVHHLALQFLARGHQVLVVTSHMGPGHRDADFVRRIGRSVVVYANGGVSRLTLGLSLGRRLEMLFRGNFDVVHVHGGLMPTLGLVAPLAARRVGVPVVATFHSWFGSSPLLRLFRPLGQRLLDLHAATIAVSVPVVEAMARYVAAQWDVIPNGVDLEHFYPDGRRPPEATGAPRLLFLHRLEPRNHLTTVLRAMPRVLERHPAAKLVVAGDGPWRRRYEREAAPLGDRVTFLGRVVAAGRVSEYRAADLYLCPTMRASFGITLLEAMACATPMIVADNPGFRALVNGGREAVLVPHDDPRAWSDTILRLLADPGRRRSMSAAGPAKAAEYGWPGVADRVLAVYERVVRRAG